MSTMKSLRETMSWIWSTAVPAIALAGCLASGTTDGPVCQDNLDCPTGWQCDRRISRCEPMSNPSSSVDLELTPLHGSGSTPTQVAELNRREPSRFEVELNKAVAFSGQVKSPLGVDGGLIVKRTAGFDARRLSWNIEVGSDGYFDAALAPADGTDGDGGGATYDLFFLPANRADMPQLRYSGLQVPADGLNKVLEYPAYPSPDALNDQRDLLLIKLRVLQSESSPQPLTGIRVEGTTVNGLRTNLATPNAQGYAYLRLPVVRRADRPDDELVLPAWLELTIRSADEQKHLPTVRVADVELDNPDLGTFYLGDVPPYQLVRGSVQTAAGQPVPGCQLRFQSDVIANGSLELTRESDKHGEFSVSLPAGVYEITALPDVQSPQGLTRITFRLEAEMEPVIITLDERLSISGTVQDHDTNPVADVLVQAVRIRAWTGEDDGISRTYEATGDYNGRFRLLLDPGRYDLTFIPPAKSGLPWLLHRDLLFVTHEALDADHTTLPQPTVIQGHVFNHAGSPMCGVTVDVYRTEDEAILIGKTVSGSDAHEGCNGAYSVVIPDIPNLPPNGS